MKIALIGYGKMGQAIERIAAARGHDVMLKISSLNRDDLNVENLSAVDVAIEFTVPKAAPGNVAICLKAGVPVVCGTTGWNDGIETTQSLATNDGVGFLHASNFSIGVNIFFEINKLLARLMSGQQSYEASIEEVHHLQKKDKPSGTAITLAEQILAESEDLKSWVLDNTSTAGVLGISALREERVPGTHKISWTSAVDTIDIIHTAHNRDGFALGAVLAAEFIFGRSGVFTMKDVLSL